MQVKSRITEPELQGLLRPRLLLFLSADIEGSSRLKQQGGSEPYKTWLPPLFGFLKEFGEDFTTERARLAETWKQLEPEAPTIWKILGDELVYFVELRHRSEAAFHVQAFADTVSRRNIKSSEKAQALRLKASAWLGGFPVDNTLIPLEDGSSDYLGAAIDLGFRLARFANPRMMVVSVDLAWLLLSVRKDFKIYYEGRRALKGILEDEGYPILLVDTGGSDLQRQEDQLAKRNACESGTLLEFCRLFVERSGHPRHLPFIQGDQEFSQPPADYEKQLKAVEGFLRADLFIVTEEEGQVAPAVPSPSLESEINEEVEALEPEKPPGDKKA